jgi:hypothetical protein
MKEKYTSPKLELICFASSRNLAADGEVDFGDLSNPGGVMNPASDNFNDVITPVPVTPVN